MPQETDDFGDFMTGPGGLGATPQAPPPQPQAPPSQTQVTPTQPGAEVTAPPTIQEVLTQPQPQKKGKLVVC